jgi:nitrate/nitrite transporter NarK
MTDLSDSQVSLVTSGIAAASVIAMLINAAHSDRSQERRLHVAIPALIAALGWLLCLRIHSGAAGVIALGLIAVGGNSLYGPFWAWPHDSPAAAASAGRIALIVALGSVGGFIGPNLVGLTKDLTGSYDVAFLVLGVMALGAALLAVAARPLQRG